VPATVNPVAHTVTASVSHLSSWGLFTINWDYWLGFIAKAASGNLTDLLGALGTLTTPRALRSPLASSSTTVARTGWSRAASRRW